MSRYLQDSSDYQKLNDYLSRRVAGAVTAADTDDFLEMLAPWRKGIEKNILGRFTSRGIALDPLMVSDAVTDQLLAKLAQLEQKPYDWAAFAQRVYVGSIQNVITALRNIPAEERNLTYLDHAEAREYMRQTVQREMTLPGRDDFSEDTRLAVDGLRQPYRQIIEDRFIHGKTIAEIGAEIGKTANKVIYGEAKALRMLKHPSRRLKEANKSLRDFTSEQEERDALPKVVTQMGRGI